MTDGDPLDLRVRQLIVDTLRLDRPADSIDPSAPLFGDGLGLDSVDALELVMGIEHAFGIKVEDQAVWREMLGSVESIVTFLRARGAGAA